jgi:hypothetical protein
MFTGRKISGMRYSLLWDFTQRRLIVCCRRFGTTHLQPSRCLTLEDGTDNLSRNVGTKQPNYFDIQRAVHRDIYYYNRSQQDALFLNFILVKNSTCFGRTYSPSSGFLILYSQQLVFVILVTLLFTKIKLRNSVSYWLLL